jgi:hypothetical protein
MTVDMVWRIEGHSRASKEYRDRQQFVDEVLAPFGVHADGDTVIVVWDGRQHLVNDLWARVPPAG